MYHDVTMTLVADIRAVTTITIAGETIIATGSAVATTAGIHGATGAAVGTSTGTRGTIGAAMTTGIGEDPGTSMRGHTAICRWS
jgi:hypothetical protein